MRHLRIALGRWATLLTLSCGVHRPETGTAPEDRDPPRMRPPPPDLLVAQYLTLRHRITGESPWVIVCPPVELANMALWEDRLLRIRSEVKSYTASSDCVLPQSARSDSVNPALAIISVERDGFRGTVQARRYSSTGPLREWTENYQFEEMDQRITIWNFPAVD